MLLLVNKLNWIKSQFLQLKNGDKKTFIHKIKKLFYLTSFFFNYYLSADISNYKTYFKFLSC